MQTQVSVALHPASAAGHGLSGLIKRLAQLARLALWLKQGPVPASVPVSVRGIGGLRGMPGPAHLHLHPAIIA